MASVESATEPGKPPAEAPTSSAQPRSAVGAIGRLAQLLAADDATQVEPGDGETQLNEGNTADEPSSDDQYFSIKPPSGAVLPPSASRKRARSEEREVAKSPAALPPIPKLSGDSALEAFTHRSLSRPGQLIDGSQLAVLGLSVLETAMTMLLFRQQLPLLTDAEMVAKREELLTLDKIEQWTVAYGLMDKLRCAPAAYASLKTAPERYRVFLAVAGAIYVDHGILTMQNWLGQLVYGESYAEEIAPPEPASAMPPQKKQRSNRGRGRSTRPPEYQAKLSNSSGPLQPPPPAVIPVPGPNQFIPAAAPPPVFNAVGPPPMVMPPAAATVPPPAPPNKGRTFLLAFHEHAVKRGVRVEYETEGQMGPNPTAAHWIMVCKANGIPKGRGFGKTKQIAKEFAARQAFTALGWV
ncbi:hypothetical protein GGF50DRAFT_93819 [Schizophyllum commune]